MTEFELDRSVDAVAIKAGNPVSSDDVNPLAVYPIFLVTPLVFYNVVAAAHTVAAVVNAGIETLAAVHAVTKLYTY